MRRVFTHLTQGWQRVLPSMTKCVFFENPDFPSLSMATTNKTTKVSAQRARGSRETLFFLFIYLFHLINQLNSISLLTSLKDARTRRLPESRSGPGPPTSNEAAVRLCNPCVLRTRTTSHQRRRTLQETQACSRQVSKKIKKIKKIQKNE